eukprot:364768-Chlamydomonas_euryale.AAC.9
MRPVPPRTVTRNSASSNVVDIVRSASDVESPSESTLCRSRSSRCSACGNVPRGCGRGHGLGRGRCCPPGVRQPVEGAWARE